MLLLLTLVAALLVPPGFTPSASAHTELVSVTPADRSTVASATRVTLTFSEALRKPSVVVVTGPDGDRVDVGPTMLDQATATVRVRLSGRGRHTVAYRVVSADGHPVTGRTTFGVRPVAATPSASPSESASASGVPSSGSPTPSTDAETSTPSPASASGTAADSGPGAGTVAGWTAAGVLLLGAAVLLLARGRRGASRSDPGGQHR